MSDFYFLDAAFHNPSRGNAHLQRHLFVVLRPNHAIWTSPKAQIDLSDW